MFQPNEEKTTFVTPQVLYCYSHAIWTQECWHYLLETHDKNLQALIGRTVGAYIDDIVVKSETWAEHIQHLEEAFRLMWAYNMKLNLAKCDFNVSVGKFQGFMVT